MGLGGGAIKDIPLLLDDGAKGLIYRNGNVSTCGGICRLVLIIVTAGREDDDKSQEDNVDESLHGAQVYVIFI